MGRNLTGPLTFILSHPLCQANKIAAVGRFVSWQIRSRLTSKAMVHEWVEGSKFFVRAGETGLTQNIYTGLHEFAEMAFVLHFLRRDDLFVDVGANAGSYTILACAARGAIGYALEPVPGTYRRLSDNVHLNGLDDRVNSLNIAAGSERGTIQFTNNMDTVNHALASGERAESSVAVHVYPLDTVLAEESPALMKIDVEGFETPIVEGARETLLKRSLKAVIMELNGSGKRYGWDESLILKKMKDFGFKTYAYNPFLRRLDSLNGNASCTGNTLFVRDEPIVLERVSSAPHVKLLGNRF